MRTLTQIKKQSLLILSTLLSGLVIFLGSEAVLDAQAPASSAPLIAATSPDRIVIVFEAPLPARSQVVINREAFDRLELPGFGVTGEPGTPALPAQRRMVAVPPGATVDLQVEAARAIPLPGTVRPLPVPYSEPVSPVDDAAELPTGIVPRYVPDRAVYARDAWVPGEVMRIAERGTWRGVEFVVLEFTPVQVNPVQGAARYVPRVAATLTFEGGVPPAAGRAAESEPDRLAPLFHTLFLNGDAARAWQRPSGTSARDTTRGPMTGRARWRIEVRVGGLQRLTGGDLAAAGVPVDTIDPRKLHLTWKDQPVALWVEGEEDGNFDNADALYFYAPPPGSRWADYDVYWLTVETSNGLRMGSRDATPVGEPAVTTVWGTYTLNPQNIYLPYDLQSDEKWFHSTIVPPVRPSTEVMFPRPPDFVTTTKPVTITFDLAPRPDAARNRRMSAALNGTPIAEDVDWSYSTPSFFTYATTVPGTDIDISSTLVVTTTAISYFDAVRLEYHRALTATDGAITFRHSPAGRQRFEISGLADTRVWAFDVSVPTQPVRLTGGTKPASTFTFASDGTAGTAYFVTGSSAIRTPTVTAVPPSTLRDPSHAVDYLVISHPAFIEALQPLIDHRAAQGLRPLVVDVTEVYNEFGGGTPDPEAIRTFVSYAYHNWSVRPAYLLLVGDGTYDPLDYLGTGVQNWLPPYLGDYDPEIGETASDNAYATVDGDDPVPDLLVGRLAVNSAAETTAIVNKILAYEATPPGAWQRRFLLTTDDAPDPAADFYALSDNVVADLFPAGVEVVRAYMEKKANTTEQNTEALRIRDLIAETLNTEGAAVIQYIGHAGRREWAFPAIWTLRSRNDMDQLHNGIYPVSLSWTCWESYFIDPTEQSLAEQMVRADGKGAVAVFGPTGLDVATGHDWLARGWYAALFNDGETGLGALALAAKVNLYQNAPVYGRLLNTFMLHGDPALQLGIDSTLLPQKKVYVPLVLR